MYPTDLKITASINNEAKKSKDISTISSLWNGLVSRFNIYECVNLSQVLHCWSKLLKGLWLCINISFMYSYQWYSTLVNSHMGSSEEVLTDACFNILVQYQANDTSKVQMGSYTNDIKLWLYKNIHNRSKCKSDDRLLCRIWAGTVRRPGGRLDLKMPSYQYRDPHGKDKTVSRPSYLQHDNSHTLERRFLYWDGALIVKVQQSEGYYLIK